MERRVDPDNGLTFSDVPPEQESELTTAINECQAEYPVSPPTPENLNILYKAEVEQRLCLIGLGYELPEPPTLATYIDTYMTDPWFAIADASQKRCLQPSTPRCWRSAPLPPSNHRQLASR
jgi:hypothetical protein